MQYGADRKKVLSSSLGDKIFPAVFYSTFRKGTSGILNPRNKTYGN